MHPSRTVSATPWHDGQCPPGVSISGGHRGELACRAPALTAFPRDRDADVGVTADDVGARISSERVVREHRPVAGASLPACGYLGSGVSESQTPETAARVPDRPSPARQRGAQLRLRADLEAGLDDDGYPGRYGDEGAGNCQK